MSLVFRRGIWSFMLVVSLWAGRVSTALAASGSREETISRPFNVMWLVILMLTIAVFLLLGYFDQSVELKEPQNNRQS